MFAEPFTSALAPALHGDLPVPDVLERSLRDAHAHAVGAWPDVGILDPPAFARHVAERTRTPARLAEVLANVNVDGLYLACACVQRDEAAARALEAIYASRLRASLVKLRLDDSLVADVQQTVLERLLVPRRESPPRIAEYDGSGALEGWLRVVAVREGLALAKKGRREIALSDALVDVPFEQDDPELAYLKARYRAEYREAFALAVAELDDEQRMLLRQQIIQGLTVDRIGAILGVHRASAARRVAQAREDLLANTRRQLTLRLRVPREEIEEIVRLIQSGLDVSLRRLLGQSGVTK